MKKFSETKSREYYITIEAQVLSKRKDNGVTRYVKVFGEQEQPYVNVATEEGTIKHYIDDLMAEYYHIEPDDIVVYLLSDVLPDEQQSKLAKLIGNKTNTTLIKGMYLLLDVVNEDTTLIGHSLYSTLNNAYRSKLRLWWMADNYGHHCATVAMCAAKRLGGILYG